jgi:hypothetical protein
MVCVFERDVNVTCRRDDEVPGNTNLVRKDRCAEPWRQRDATVSPIAAIAQSATALACAARDDAEHQQSVSEQIMNPYHGGLSKIATGQRVRGETMSIEPDFV